MTITTAIAAPLQRSMMTLGEIELEIFSGGNGRPLVFLHGGGGFSPEARFARLLAKKFRVIVPMHPGFGGSSLPDWLDTVDDFAHVHLELFDKLALRNAVLVGASIGGWTAAEIATKSSQHFDHLILVDPVGIKVGSRDQLDFPDVFAQPPELMEKLLFHDPVKFKPDMSKKTDAEVEIMARNRETLALVGWKPYLHNPKLKHRLHRIDRPTLILRGASDGLVSADYAAAYAKLIPGAVLETIPEAGHQPQVEQPEKFVASIEAFAARQGSRK